jgi:hypothetical protein
MIWLEAIRAEALYYIYINTKAVNGDTCPQGYVKAMSHQMVGWKLVAVLGDHRLHQAMWLC